MTLLPRIAARLFDTPLLVDPRKAAAILGALGGRLVPGATELDGITAATHVAFSNGRMGVVGDPLGSAFERSDKGSRLVPLVADGVGIIEVQGSLVHKGGWIGSYSGETSYQGIQAQVARARRDDRIKAVAFEIDSFGGEVDGAFATADMIAQLSAEKPTIAILTDSALSAGYLMASACRQIVAPSTGWAGSIGVISMHLDVSTMMEGQGAKVTLITSGAHKADGNPYEPLPDDVRAKWQTAVDQQRDLFAAYVGRGRGQRLTKADALKTEADVFSGREARSRGLIDAVGNPADAFASFLKQVNSRR